MFRVESEPTATVLGRAKTVHALDHTAIVMGPFIRSVKTMHKFAKLIYFQH
jgi:hypothetical protein